MTFNLAPSGNPAANDDDIAAAVDLLHAVARGVASPVRAVTPRAFDRRIVDCIAAIAGR